MRRRPSKERKEDVGAEERVEERDGERDVDILVVRFVTKRAAGELHNVRHLNGNKPGTAPLEKD